MYILILRISIHLLVYLFLDDLLLLVFFTCLFLLISIGLYKTVVAAVTHVACLLELKLWKKKKIQNHIEINLVSKC